MVSWKKTGVHKWIKEFLNNRTQCTCVNGTLSDIIHVTSGVPQGSVLGPVLFLLYINDINKHISSKCKLYADDTTLYRNINNTNDSLILQNDLNEILNWSKMWLMEFNTDKCFVMHISKKTHLPMYTHWTIKY